MKIVHIIETPGTGGAEKLLVDIATRLPPEFTSLGVMMCESWTGRELAKHGIPVTVMPLLKSFDLGWPMRFAKFLHDNRVDVVQSHEFTANVYATAGAKLARVPIVCTTHGKNYWPHALYRRAAYRWAARNSRAFVAVSTDLGKFVSSTLGIPDRRVRVIRNGIDMDVYRRDPAARSRIRSELAIEDSQPLLLACGELSEVKGHEWFLRALPRILASRPDAVIVLAGDGPLRSQLEALTAELGIGANVRFVGFRRDVPALLSSADVFVMPSLSEGLPLAILEAMATGVPIVATEVGGMPEVIRQNQTGWLAPSKNPDALASAILEVLSAGPAQNAIIDAARRLCGERYALQETLRAYVSCYRGGKEVDRPSGDAAPVQ